MRVIAIIGLSLIASLSGLTPARAQRSPAVAVPSSAEGRRVATLMHAYVSWRGGSRFQALRSVHARGSASSQGVTGSSERWISGVDHYREDIAIGAIRSTERVASREAWKTAFSGQAQRLSVAERRDALHRAAVLMPVPPGVGAGELGLKPDELIAGHPLKVLAFRTTDGDGVDYLLTPTGVLHAVRFHEGGETRLVTYSDWRIVDGVQMPFSEVIKEDGERTELRFTQIEINPDIEPSVFAKPASSVAVTFGSGGSSDWLDFELFEGTRIFISALVNGRRAQVMLDSGAEASVIDRSYLSSAGLQPVNETTATGLNATSTAAAVPGVDVQLGAAKISGMTVAAIDLTAVSAQMGHPLPVILGLEIFRDAVVDIDFAARRIAFRDPASFVPPGEAVPAAITSD